VAVQVESTALLVVLVVVLTSQMQEPQELLIKVWQVQGRAQV
jgi:hypothetical protein